MDRVEKNLWKLISNGCYGDRGSLPSLKELAEILEGTRNEVRGALHALEQAGAVRFTLGMGWIVTKRARMILEEGMGIRPARANLELDGRMSPDLQCKPISGTLDPPGLVI